MTVKIMCGRRKKNRLVIRQATINKDKERKGRGTQKACDKGHNLIHIVKINLL